MAADLVFARAAPADAHLVFGDEAGTEPSSAITVRASIRLGGVTVRAFVVPPVKAAASIRLGGVTVRATAFYDNRVTPWKDSRAAVLHNPAQPAGHENSDDWQTSRVQLGGTRLPSGKGTQRPTQTQAGFDKATPQTASRATEWATAIKKAQASSTAYQKALAHQASRTGDWQLGDDRRVDTMSAMQAGIFKVHHKLAVWQTAVATRLTMDHPAGASLRYQGILLVLPWGMAGFPDPGKSAIKPPEPPIPPTFWWGPDLLFECPPLAYPSLVFGDSCNNTPTGQSFFAILPARFYMTVHSIFAQRLPDLADIPIFDATVAADSGSYCWSLTATGPAELFELLAPVGGLPAQLLLMLDGLPFLFAVDSLSRAAQFGKAGVRVSGRSVTSLIAAPYLRAQTRSNATDMTAQQLAEDALTYSGVSLDWGLTDWLVPAGSWSHQGTPLEAVQAITQAAGGYLQSARNAASILTRHPYSQRTGDNPGAPWGWMTGPADVELAPDALITSSITRKDGPDINGVYVSGTTAGVLALVKRTGTAADKLASMVTDGLITSTEAARQRGLSILGAGGVKYEVALELPVLTAAGQPGILDVGQLVQVNESTPWRGRVRSVSVAARQPSLRQTVVLERHLEVA